MPHYDYAHLEPYLAECSLGFCFERFEPMSATKLTVCEVCKGPIERLIGSGAGLIFKGTGFYQTDYKKTSENTTKSETTAETPIKTETTAKSEIPVASETSK